MLDKILNESQLSEETQTQIKQEFEALVEAEATKIASEEIEKAKAELEEEAEKAAEEIKEEEEEKAAELEESLSSYIDKLVEELVESLRGKLNADIANSHADAIIEGFDAMLTTTGVKIAKINERLDESRTSDYDRLASKYDRIVEEVSELRKENKQLKFASIVDKLAEGMSILEKERFYKAASLLEQEDVENPEIKLETLKGTIAEQDEVENPEIKLEPAKGGLAERVSAKRTLTESIQNKNIDYSRWF